MAEGWGGCVDAAPKAKGPTAHGVAWRANAIRARESNTDDKHMHAVQANGGRRRAWTNGPSGRRGRKAERGGDHGGRLGLARSAFTQARRHGEIMARPRPCTLS